MLSATIVTAEQELIQINQLNQLNYRQNITAEERDKEGFVSWFYPLPLLQQTQAIAPHIIVKEDDKVVAYALTLLKQEASFHKDLNDMFDNLAHVNYKGRLLTEHNFYCMGQICIDKPWRGKGVFAMLYNHHKKVFSNRFDMLITEVSASNPRSQRAHEKVGFKTIHSYTDANDEWNVITWDWKA